MYPRSKDKIWTSSPLHASSLAMKMKNSDIGYEIQIRSRDVMFKENLMFKDFENPTKSSDSSSLYIVTYPASPQVTIDGEEM